MPHNTRARTREDIEPGDLVIAGGRTATIVIRQDNGNYTLKFTDGDLLVSIPPSELQRAEQHWETTPC